jgi:hypothetical protein
LTRVIVLVAVLLAGAATAGAQHPGYSNICSTHWGWCPLNPEVMVNPHWSDPPPPPPLLK